MITDEWKKVKLGDVAVNYDNKRIPLSSMQRNTRKGVYPYYGAQGIIDSIDDYIFDGQYLLVAEDGENLKSKKENIVNIAKGKFWVNNHAHIIQNNDLSDFLYLYYILNNIDIASYITGSAQPKLNQANLNSIEIPLPPLVVQRKISDILSSLDAKIVNNRAVNHHLEQIAQAIFKSWFVDFEPWGGKMPNDWKWGTFGDCLATIESGTRPKGGAESEGVPSIGAENIERFGCYDYSKEKYVSRAFYRQMKRGIVKSGDVLLYKDGAYTGKVSMALDGFPHTECAVNEHVFILRANDIFLTQFYLYFWLCLDESRNRLFAMASSKAAQPGLNQNEVQSLSVLIPNINVVRKFNETVKSIMYAIAHNAIENRYLSETRDRLLPKLMSGEIEVII